MLKFFIFLVAIFIYTGVYAQIESPNNTYQFGVKYNTTFVNADSWDVTPGRELVFYDTIVKPNHIRVSPFKREPHLALPFNVRYYHAVIKLDSIVNVYRFAVPISPVGFTFNGTYQASAGVEYGFQHQDYNYATQTYTVLYSVNAVWMPVNTAQTIKSIKDIETFGILVGFKKNLVQVGPFCNPNASDPKDRFGIWAVVAVNLN